MLSQKQKAILNYIEDRDVKKSQIVNKFRSWHYCNSSKHIGEILSRMVKKGLLTRVKIGIYKRGTKLSKENKEPVIENQISLF